MRLGRVLRGGAFVILFALHAVAIIGLGQRLVLWPAMLLMPRRRTALTRAWLRFNAYATTGMARIVAGVRLRVHGAIPPESCVVVMNHQSVLDIPLGVSLIPGPQVVIPTRNRYRRGVPGISPLVRLARFPLVSQGRTLTRDELRGLTEAAERVDRGELSMLIFPEGHRTRDGRLGRFMRGGLRIVLEHTRRPVYCIVADGMTRARTAIDTIAGLAGNDVTVRILGPFTPPHDGSVESTDAFVESLHEQMTETLASMRREPSEHGRASSVAAH